jgi:hypothetical protein
MDKWRWSVFSGNTTDKDLNEYWWALREELQGLRPPVSRSEDDFDAGAKYHIPANVSLKHNLSTLTNHITNNLHFVVFQQVEYIR